MIFATLLQIISIYTFIHHNRPHRPSLSMVSPTIIYTIYNLYPRNSHPIVILAYSVPIVRIQTIDMVAPWFTWQRLICAFFNNNWWLQQPWIMHIPIYLTTYDMFMETYNSTVALTNWNTQPSYTSTINIINSKHVKI